MSVLIKGGRVLTAADDYVGDVYVEGERISLIGESLDVQADKVIDAAGKYLLPGGIDPHTHLDMPFGGTVTIDDVESGQTAAAFGGTTCHVDFVIQPQGSTFGAALDDWKSKANGKQVIDMGYHMAVTDLKEGGTLEELRRCPTSCSTCSSCSCSCSSTSSSSACSGGVDRGQPARRPSRRRRSPSATRAARRATGSRKHGPLVLRLVAPPELKGRSLPARRRDHRRAGRRLPGHHRRHVRVAAARARLPAGRAGVRGGPRLHERHLPEPSQGHRPDAAPARRQAPDRQHRAGARLVSERRPPGRRGHPRRPAAHHQPGRLRAPPRPRPVRRRRRHGRAPGRRGRVAARHRDAPGRLPGATPPTSLAEAIAVANHRIRNEGDADPNLRGMGTTVVALALMPDEPDADEPPTTTTSAVAAPRHRQRGRQPRLPLPRRRARRSSPRTTAWSPTSCATAASPPRRRRSTRSATSSPGCSGVYETRRRRPLADRPGHRRPVPALLRRALQRGRHRPDRQRAAPPRRPDRGRGRAGAPRQRGRRPRQHHRRRRRRGRRRWRRARRPRPPSPASPPAWSPARRGRPTTSDDLAGFTTAMPAVAAAGLSRRGSSSRARTDDAVARGAPRRAEADAPHAVHLAGARVRAAARSPSSAAPSPPSSGTARAPTTSTFEDDEVVIYQGRPGGILWVDPELEERTGIDRDDVPARYVPALEDGSEHSSLAEAQALRRQHPARHRRARRRQARRPRRPPRRPRRTTAGTTTTQAN